MGYEPGASPERGERFPRFFYICFKDNNERTLDDILPLLPECVEFVQVVRDGIPITHPTTFENYAYWGLEIHVKDDNNLAKLIELFPKWQHAYF